MVSREPPSAHKPGTSTREKLPTPAWEEPSARAALCVRGVSMAPTLGTYGAGAGSRSTWERVPLPPCLPPSLPMGKLRCAVPAGSRRLRSIQSPAQLVSGPMMPRECEDEGASHGGCLQQDSTCHGLFSGLGSHPHFQTLWSPSSLTSAPALRD